MFEKISKLFKIYKFSANAILKDGTEIRFDGNLDVGVSVYVQTADGEQPLPDGEYPLGGDLEGTSIVVQDGQVTDILETVAEVPVEEAPAAEQSEEEPIVEQSVEEATDFSETIENLQKSIDELNERISGLEKANQNLSKENETLKQSNTDFSEQIKEFELKLEKTNGATPLKKNVDANQGSTNFSSRLSYLNELKKQKIIL